MHWNNSTREKSNRKIAEGDEHVDIQWSRDDAWELITAVVGVLATAGEIPKDRAKAILCEEHAGDGSRHRPMVNALAKALKKGYQNLEPGIEAWEPGSKYMIDGGAPGCLAAQ